MAPLRPQTAADAEVLGVSDLNAHVRGLLASDPALQGVHVRGEISRLTRAASGHLYFTLKDDAARVDCAMWRSSVTPEAHALQEGVEVVVVGNVDLYPEQGRYQLIVRQMFPAGEGLLWLRFTQLKKKLETEGLFARKRPLPRLPRRVGIITSRDAAAYQDILKVVRRRAPYLELVLADARVQGAEAVPSLVRALGRMARAEVDVVILARGGGSMEDLWAFNEEAVVRAVYAMPMPVVCGVGHETDTTLCDFVADLRAPTPSAAAESVAPSVDELLRGLDDVERRLAHRLVSRLELARSRFDALASRAVLRRPEAVFAPTRQRLDDAARRIPRALTQHVALARQQVAAAAGKLDALSPLKVLGRGYAVATRDGRALTTSARLSPGDVVDVRLHEGGFAAEVRRVRPTKERST